MTATYTISREELNVDFIEAIKRTFKTEKIFIQIDEVMDETEYLLSNPANKAMLLQSLENDRNGNMIEISLDEHNKILEELKLRVANCE